MSNFINNTALPYIANTEESAEITKKKQKSLFGGSQNQCIINMSFEKALSTLRSGIYNRSNDIFVE